MGEDRFYGDTARILQAPHTRTVGRGTLTWLLAGQLLYLGIA